MHFFSDFFICEPKEAENEQIFAYIVHKLHDFKQITHVKKSFWA